MKVYSFSLLGAYHISSHVFWMSQTWIAISFLLYPVAHIRKFCSYTQLWSGHGSRCEIVKRFPLVVHRSLFQKLRVRLGGTVHLVDELPYYE